MTKIKRFSLALVLTLFVLVLTAHAQTPSIEVSTDADNVEFSAQGVTRRVHVEVFSPSGELVFETDDSDGQSIRWGMVNQLGERVSDGVYLATITVVDSLGKRRKRIEQVTVSSERQPWAAAATASAPSPSPDAPVTTTVNGTAGRLAKFTGASTVGNSAVTEGAGKIGVNVAPSATLQVNGLQPAPLAANGTNASVLLQTTGGKGGNTTVSGKTAGAGASISLVAGNGGDGPSGSLPGKGGSIILQPGGVGTVLGTGVKNGNGNILLAPSGVGNVGIGTGSPLTSLHVVSGNPLPPRLQSTVTSSFAAGWDFYHGATGKGYVGVPGAGVGSPGPGEMLLYGGTGVKTSLWAGATRGITIDTRGFVSIGTTDPSDAYSRLYVEGGPAISGATVTGVTGTGVTGTGVAGKSDTGHGVYGFTRSKSLGSTSGAAIFGFNTSGGWAGYFNGPVAITGGCQGCTTPASDRALKANITAVNPRSVLDKLASVPIQQWNYKTDSPSVRHVGPMAQDFRAAFQLGRDDKHIDLIDANGVTMASIQALYQLMLEKDRQNEQLALEIRQLRAQMLRQQSQLQQQQAQLNQVRRTIRGRRARVRAR